MLKEKRRLCPECKGQIEPGHTDMVYELKGIKITIKYVTANICSKCGQSFVSGHVAEEVNRLVNRVNEDVNSFIKTQPETGKRHKEVAIAV
ncbi:MAG: YgiT-type zinc finger protein [Nitrospirae bacterium]|nr:YgiT-type zinc finger protein [Nitrospirota bacterium]